MPRRLSESERILQQRKRKILGTLVRQRRLNPKKVDCEKFTQTELGLKIIERRGLSSSSKNKRTYADKISALETANLKTDDQLLEEDIRAIAAIFKLGYDERMYWLDLFSDDITPETAVPEASDIILLLDSYKKYLTRWMYPAYVIDHRWTFWVVNSPAISLIDGGRNVAQDLMSKHVTILDLVFSEKSTLRSIVRNAEDFYLYQMQRFKLYNLNSLATDPYFLSFPERMQPKINSFMNAADYERFAALWNEVDPFDYETIVRNPLAESRSDELFGIFRYELPIGWADFRLEVEQIPYLHNYFSVIRYHLVRAENQGDLEDYLASDPYPPLLLWEVMGESSHKMLREAKFNEKSIEIIRDAIGFQIL